jgi:hypothetical protein
MSEYLLIVLNQTRGSLALIILTAPGIPAALLDSWATQDRPLTLNTALAGLWGRKQAIPACMQSSLTLQSNSHTFLHVLLRSFIEQCVQFQGLG